MIKTLIATRNRRLVDEAGFKSDKASKPGRKEGHAG